MRRVISAAAMALGLATMGVQSQSANALIGVWKVAEIEAPQGAANSNPQPTLYVFTARHYSHVSVTYVHEASSQLHSSKRHGHAAGGNGRAKMSGFAQDRMREGPFRGPLRIESNLSGWSDRSRSAGFAEYPVTA